MMRNKRDIYCDYQFWEDFFKVEDQVRYDRPKRKLWDSFYVFLSNNNLFFNIPCEKVDNNTVGGKNLNEIRQKKGGAGIKFIPQEFPNIEDFTDEDDNRLNSVFLTMLDTSLCVQLSRRFGVIIFNLDMIFSAEHVFVDTKISFDRTNMQNWSFLMELRDKYPSIGCCNSLVIADRYLLANSNVNVFDGNLKPIFEAILPQSLDNGIVYTIYIIAENKGQSIGAKLKRLEQLIMKIRPELSFKLNIFNSKKLHDRSILTNNFMLISGAGFEIIGNDGIPIKSTHISLSFPFLQLSNSDNSVYLDWIKNVIDEVEKCNLYQEEYWGAKTKRHHLLDFYYEEPVLPRASYSLGELIPEKLLQAFA